MTISWSDNKLLWTRAAGRCSLCKVQVFAKKSSGEAFSIGHNAHIVAKSPGGPRGESTLTAEERDTYGNLILLCPSCHQKVDSNVADFGADVLHFRKREHEIRIEASTEQAFAKGILPCFAPDGSPNDQSYERVRVVESPQELLPGDPIRSSNLWYKVDIEYPKFLAGSHSALAEVNRVVAGDVTRRVQETRRRAISGSGTEYDGAAELAGHCNVHLLSERYVSLYIDYYVTSGGAHGEYERSSYTFMLAPCVRLSVSDLFKDTDRAGEELSRLARRVLIEQHGPQLDPAWLEEGTPARIDAYSIFTLSPEGLVLYFEPYRIDCWAGGPYSAVIPYKRLAPVLKAEFGGTG